MLGLTIIKAKVVDGRVSCPTAFAATRAATGVTMIAMMVAEVLSTQFAHTAPIAGTVARGTLRITDTTHILIDRMATRRILIDRMATRR